MPRNWPILVLKTLSPSVPDSSSQKCLQLSQARRTLTTAAASSPSQLEGMSRYHQSPAIGWGTGVSEVEEERTWLYSWRNFWDSCVTQLRNQTPTTGHFPAGREAQGSEGRTSDLSGPCPLVSGSYLQRNRRQGRRTGLLRSFAPKVPTRKVARPALELACGLPRSSRLRHAGPGGSPAPSPRHAGLHLPSGSFGPPVLAGTSSSPPLTC